ncbi:MAG TPA: 5'/3'-nucleotidase SurE [Clostridiales bacterium]|nr:5'/3'-nucleotidase SurE [Clostridiales bacterium]
MNVLVTNDDGFQSEGIVSLAEVLVGKGYNVTVLAPDGNRSAFAHSLTIHKSVRFSEEKSYAGAKVYSLSGTPADCVKFAVHHFENIKFDLVCSGINHGNNLGSDVQYSGTVSAGLEANFFGIPSIAFSNVGRKKFFFEENKKDIAEILRDLIGAASDKYTLNVNMPNGKSKGVKIAPLGRQLYSDGYVMTDDGGFKLVGEPIECLQSEEYDVPLSSLGYVTVTPVKFDRTDYQAVEKLRGIFG